MEARKRVTKKSSEQNVQLMETIEERMKRVPRSTRGNETGQQKLMKLYYEHCALSKRKRRSEENQGRNRTTTSGSDKKAKSTDTRTRKSEPVQCENIVFLPIVKNNEVDGLKSGSSKTLTYESIPDVSTEKNVNSHSTTPQASACRAGNELQLKPRAKKTLPSVPRRSICNLYYPAYDGSKENLPVPLETINCLPGDGSKDVKMKTSTTIRRYTTETQTEQNLKDAESQTLMTGGTMAVQTQTERNLADAESQTLMTGEKIAVQTQTESDVADAGAQTTSNERTVAETQTERNLTENTRCIGTDPIDMRVLEQTTPSVMKVSLSREVRGVKIAYVQQGWLKLLPAYQ